MSGALKLPALDEHDFLRLQRLMADASGIHMTPNKRPLVAGRLLKRLRHYSLDSYADYLELLDQPQHQKERRLVVDLLTTNETYFFREHPHFDFFGTWLHQRKGPLRIWSAACSSGEEPYSLAMTACECAATPEWSILGSDLSQSMLQRAREGIYNMTQAKYFPKNWLERHCLRGVDNMDGLFRVQASLRSRVELREINIIQPLPENLGQFDAIFLRNVLIYFNNEEKQRIIQRLLPQLKPNGLFVIGHAESIHGFDLPLRLLNPSVYEYLL
jgi:chemotaxis protein methyltransferase CheR